METSKGLCWNPFVGRPLSLQVESLGRLFLFCGNLCEFILVLGSSLLDQPFVSLPLVPVTLGSILRNALGNAGGGWKSQILPLWRLSVQDKHRMCLKWFLTLSKKSQTELGVLTNGIPGECALENYPTGSVGTFGNIRLDLGGSGLNNLCVRPWNQGENEHKIQILSVAGINGGFYLHSHISHLSCAQGFIPRSCLQLFWDCWLETAELSTALEISSTRNYGLLQRYPGKWLESFNLHSH